MVGCVTGERMDVIWSNLVSMKLQLRQQHHGAGHPEQQEDGRSTPAPAISGLRFTHDQARISEAPTRNFV